jgi:hypothetical protein
MGDLCCCSAARGWWSSLRSRKRSMPRIKPTRSPRALRLRSTNSSSRTASMRRSSPLHAGVGSLRGSVRARCVELERAHGDLEHRFRSDYLLDRRAGVRWERLSHASAGGDQRERAVLLRAAVPAYVGPGRFSGIARDGEYLVDQITLRLQPRSVAFGS